jgi:molecular chaperone GrpE
MNLDNELDNQDNPVFEVEDEGSLSIEDFIRELEAKEKDLQISAGIDIEIDDPDFDDTNPPEFIKSDFAIEVAKPSQKKPEAASPKNDKAVSDLEKKVAEFREQVSKLEGERATLNETIRRRQNDFDNFKKRTERDRGETFLNQISNLATQMLPVLDNLNRALDFAATHSEGRSQDFEQFFEGIALVNQQLNEVMAEMGVLPIAAVGNAFDPYYHEAVATEITGSFAPNTVTGELLRGYRIGEKVIRPAMVRVSIAGVGPTSTSNAAEESAATDNPPDES